FRQIADALLCIIATLFPTFVTIADDMFDTSPPASQEIPAMLHLILNRYKLQLLSTFLHARSPEPLVPWRRLLFRVAEMIVLVEGVQINEKDWERCECWKAKK
ncbi:hypothetical protein BDR07DRAFT_1182271, partial [Suillus spraguei]